MKCYERSQLIKRYDKMLYCAKLLVLQYSNGEEPKRSAFIGNFMIEKAMPLLKEEKRANQHVCTILYRLKTVAKPNYLKFIPRLSTINKP